MKTQLHKSTDLYSKKNAIKSKLRRDWLDAYFQNIRDHMLQEEKRDRINLQKMEKSVDQLLEKLPPSIFELQQMQSNNPTQFNRYLLYRLPKLPNKMIGLSLTEWCYYTHFISHLLVTKDAKQSSIIELINYSHKTILQHAKLFIETEHKIKSHEILGNSMEYLLRMGDHVVDGDMIDIQIISKIIKQDIALNCEDGEKYFKNLEICNKIVCATLPPQNEENIPPSMLINLEMLKRSFVMNTFFGESIGNFKNIIALTVHHVTSNQQSSLKKIIIEYFLRLMVNLTHFIDEDYHFLLMLNLNIGQVINMALLFHKIDPQICILAVKLINNFMVSGRVILERMNDILLWSNIGKLIEHFANNPPVMEQIMNMMSNAVFAANDSKEIVRFYIEKGARTLLLDNLKTDLEAQLLQKILLTIITFNDYDPIGTRRELRQKSFEVIQEIGERYSQLRQTAESIIVCMRENCFEEQLDIQTG